MKLVILFQEVSVFFQNLFKTKLFCWSRRVGGNTIVVIVIDIGDIVDINIDIVDNVKYEYCW